MLEGKHYSGRVGTRKEAGYADEESSEYEEVDEEDVDEEEEEDIEDGADATENKAQKRPSLIL